MRHFALALAATLAFPLAGNLPGLQDPAEPPEEAGADDDEPESFERDLFGRVRKRAPGAPNPLVGAWQLLDMEAEGFPEEGKLSSGFLLVGEDFLALEMHVMWDLDLVGEALVDAYQTFICEYAVVGGSLLQCRTLIGSYIEAVDGSLQYEPSGTDREFLMELDGEFLTLKWDQTDSMTFARRRPSPVLTEDIFGKREALRNRGRGEDIFGRRQIGEEDEDR